ncbi:CoA transferase [Azospirillum sp. YIM B02556]|uniref:CoA transferase n=1 Tax=Azospirillum endophyticum TaxID=2800326 RepID=A0ABS1EZE6_9PROT|nr:CoA transferase [Azospirillum endophyticum]MBK1836542.1 CoA transferase [Azospirillum endophyticum]
MTGLPNDPLPDVSSGLPLAGIRVLDLSKVLAGPLCTQHLSDFGAEVVKVEPPGVGDETRHWPPYQRSMGAVFLSANRNKRSIAIDLKSVEGRAVVHRLTARSDIVVESFAPGVAARLGVDYDTLRQHNERLIYCSISGYGQAGPLSDGLGYDLILQAFSGMLAMTGEETGGPVRSPMSPIDQTTGMNALAGILAALVRRDRTGVGAKLEVSLFETSVGLLSYMLQSYWVSGRLPGKSGSGHPSLCPYQLFDASDRPILIGVPNDNLWRRFCRVAGKPELGTDPRFADNAARVANATEIIALVQGLVGQRSCSDWVAILAEAGVPAAPLNTLEDLLAHPHTRARGMVMEYGDERSGPLKTVAQPIRFDGLERREGARPPLLGEHSSAILREMGYGDIDIDRLLQANRVQQANEA